MRLETAIRGIKRYLRDIDRAIANSKPRESANSQRNAASRSRLSSTRVRCSYSGNRDVAQASHRVRAADRHAGKSVNPDILVICRGGPIAEPDDATCVLQHTRGLCGFFGASSIERLPTEVRRLSGSKASLPRCRALRNDNLNALHFKPLPRQTALSFSAQNTNWRGRRKPDSFRLLTLQNFRRWQWLRKPCS